MASEKWWKSPPVTWANDYPESSGVEVSPSLYLDQPITELATSANGRPRLIVDSPNGTRLGLCNSLRFHLLLLIYVEWLVDGVWLLSNIINSSLKLPGSVSMSWRNPKMKSSEYLHIKSSNFCLTSIFISIITVTSMRTGMVNSEGWNIFIVPKILNASGRDLNGGYACKNWNTPHAPSCVFTSRDCNGAF